MAQYPGRVLVANLTAILSVERRIPTTTADVPQLMAVLLDVVMAAAAVRGVLRAGEEGVDAEAEEQDLQHENRDRRPVREALE